VLTVNALALPLNVIAATDISPDREMLVMLEVAKIAVSEESAPGIFAGVQLLAVFQSPEPGLAFQAELWASLVSMLNVRTKTGRSPATNPINNLGVLRKKRSLC
jgi:hypothetical protein